jgi:glycerol-3-phosphate acyltransferase PlsX
VTLPAPIAVDAMGGDRAPDEIVAGAERAAAELDLPVVLVGDPERLAGTSLEVLPASEVIGMHDDPGQGVRRKKDSSLVRAAEAVRDGRASAMVSAGNTGATWGAALLRMGRIKGVSRPAIATPLPRPGFDTPLVLLDAGANTDCNAEWLVQFAQMGALFARDRFGTETPRVGLLSIGEEETKGTPLVVEAHGALRARMAEGGTYDFVGNVEGNEIPMGRADVIVTDGFTGNVALKLMEGVSEAMLRNIRRVATSSRRAKAGGLLLRPALLEFRDVIDPEMAGGAYLLGLRRLGVVPHGRFSRRGIAQAIRLAARATEEDVVGRTHAALQAAHALRRGGETSAAGSTVSAP